MAHEDYKQMLPELALSALDPADVRVLNQHLAECAECRRELADWESTAAALALTAAPVEPSAQLRERVMTAIRREKQASRVVSFPLSFKDKWSSFGRVGAIAAAVLGLVLIVWIFVLWQQNRALRRENDALASQIQSVEEEVTRSNDFLAILSTPGAKVTQLQGSGPASDATAQLVYDRSGRAMLMTFGLPPTPAGKEYQLWFIVGKNPPIPGKTFAANNAGLGALKDEIPRHALDSAVFAITLERAGGVSAPTSPIYLRSGL